MCHRYEIRVKFNTTYTEFQSSIYENVHPEWYIEFHSHHYRKEYKTSIGATLVWFSLFIFVASQEEISLRLARLTCWFERDFINGEVHCFAHENAWLKNRLPALYCNWKWIHKRRETVIMAILLKSCLKVFGENVNHSRKKNNRHPFWGIPCIFSCLYFIRVEWNLWSQYMC